MSTSSCHDSIYRGRLDHVFCGKSNSVRIFFSSTSIDTAEERTVLIRYVYPKLREYCQKTHQIEFQFIDMGSGGKDQISNDPFAFDKSLTELVRCCQSSLATNCIIFLDQNYGNRILPVRIHRSVFHALEKVMSDDDRDLMNQLYKLDENYVDPLFLLQPVDPTTKKNEWKETHTRLTRVLCDAAERCFIQEKTINENNRNEFRLSTTAKEIYRALEMNRNQQERMAVFFRETVDLEGEGEEGDAYDKTLLEELKVDIRKDLSANIFHYQVQWLDQTNKMNYLAQFQDDFYTLVKRQIDSHISQVKSMNPLYDEILQHALQCQRLQERYFSREHLLQQIQRKNDDQSNDKRPCILYGESGTGKSSLMSDIVIKVSEWFSNSDSVSIIFRFLGTTAQSSDMHQTLMSMMQQICIIYQLQLPVMDESKTFEELRMSFQRLLQSIPSDQRLILILDSIDQLRIKDYDCSKWLLTEYPSNVKCIVSTIPTVIDHKHDPPMTHRILDRLKSNLDDVRLIQVTELDENSAMEMFQSWLTRDQRRLTSLQMNWLESKLQPHVVYTGLYETNAEPTTLFLSLVYDITLNWHSYDEELNDRFEEVETTNHAIAYLYEPLSKKHNEKFFKHALAYLHQADGLSEVELEDIFNSDEEISDPSWIHLRNDIEKYLIEKIIDHVSVFDFYHRSFREYQICDRSTMKLIDLRLLTYFSGQLDQNSMFNLRRIHQLCRYIDNQSVEPIFLYDYQFMMNYLRCYKMTDRLVVSRSIFPQLRFLLMIYQSISDVVDRHPRNFAFEILNRLLPFVDILPERIVDLIHQCQKHCALQPLLSKPLKYSDFYLYRRYVGEVRALSTTISHIFLLLPEILLIIRTDIDAWAGHYDEYVLPSNHFQELKSHSEFVCVYSSNSVFVVEYPNQHRRTLQIPVDQLVHVDFVLKNAVLICSKTSPLIKIWNCLNMKKIGEYSLNENPLECSTLTVNDGTIIRITLTNHSTQYIVARGTFNEENLATAVTFKLISELSKCQLTSNVFFNNETDVYFTSGKSELMFYHFKRAENMRIEEKQMLPVIEQRPVSRQFFFRRMHSALIWLSSKSIVIYHSCGNYSIIPGEYQSVNGPIDSSVRTGCFDTICCLHIDGFIIDVFQWQCQENQHSYRLLSRLQLDQEIHRYTCYIGVDHGINMYCILTNGELRHFNVTVMNDLPKNCFKQHEKSENHQRIAHIQIQESFLITLDSTKCSLQLYDTTNELNSILGLRTRSSIVQVAVCSSHLLLFCMNNTLLLYLIDSKPKVLLTHNELQHDFCRIHTFERSFVIFDAQENRLMMIDTRSPSQLRTIVNFNINIDKQLNVIQPEQHRFIVVSNDHTSLLIWNHQTNSLTTRTILRTDQSKIDRLLALTDGLVVHDDQGQIRLFEDDTDEENILLEQVDVLETKGDLLAAVQRVKGRLVIYDVRNRWRGHIHVRTTVDHLYFTDDEQYLFGISIEKSILLMYSIKNGILIEKLFLDQTLPLIATIDNRLLMVRHLELVLYTIVDKEKMITLDRHSPTKLPSIFEHRFWFDCHLHETWVKL